MYNYTPLHYLAACESLFSTTGVNSVWLSDQCKRFVHFLINGIPETLIGFEWKRTEHVLKHTGQENQCGKKKEIPPTNIAILTSRSVSSYYS